MFLLAGAAGLAAFALFMGSGSCIVKTTPIAAKAASKAVAPSPRDGDEHAVLNGSAASEMSVAALLRTGRKPLACLEGAQELEA